MEVDKFVEDRIKLLKKDWPDCKKAYEAVRVLDPQFMQEHREFLYADWPTCQVDYSMRAQNHALEDHDEFCRQKAGHWKCPCYRSQWPNHLKEDVWLMVYRFQYNTKATDGELSAAFAALCNLICNQFERFEAAGATLTAVWNPKPGHKGAFERAKGVPARMREQAKAIHTFDKHIPIPEAFLV